MLDSREPAAARSTTSPRPEQLVVVVGTGTDVGKTWVSSRLLTLLRVLGTHVAARKPAQSFAADDTEPTDAELLAAATGEEVEQVCLPHRNYAASMAPPMAADALDLPEITLAQLVDEMEWAEGTEVGLVETAGGVRSPLAHDADASDLIAALQPDLVILVAESGLGTLNAVHLATEALERIEPGPPSIVVVLNRYASGVDLHRRNREWIRATRLDVVTDVDDLVARLRPHR